LIADLEFRTGRIDEALGSIDTALEIGQEIGEHWTDSLLHRRRGEFLLDRDPLNPGPVEEAFRTALVVARRQGARSFELQAALALSKLYQRVRRFAEISDVLAPSVKGLLPGAEIPEIAKARALLQGLASDSIT
jgi:predicted ATPase